MKLDCGCDTLSGYRCRLHDWPWHTATCPDCGYERALRHNTNRRKWFCESCGKGM